MLPIRFRVTRTTLHDDTSRMTRETVLAGGGGRRAGEKGDTSIGKLWNVASSPCNIFYFSYQIAD